MYFLMKEICSKMFTQHMEVVYSFEKRGTVMWITVKKKKKKEKKTRVDLHRQW